MQGKWITPAYAGKRGVLNPSQWQYGDHPRLRGEKQYVAVALVIVPGSPPPTRGKGATAGAGSRNSGITPAYAGKSFGPGFRPGSVWDHPRLRGEKSPRRSTPWPLLGSPPPTRGKGRSVLCTFRHSGITPAYAGKRLKRSHKISILKTAPFKFHSVSKILHTAFHNPATPYAAHLKFQNTPPKFPIYSFPHP